MRCLAALIAVALCSCADPEELQALSGRAAALEAQLQTLDQMQKGADAYRRAVKESPLAGLPLDVAEVTSRVTKATSGVAVSVDRSAQGLSLSLSGSAGPGRAAVALEQLALYLPDVRLVSAQLRSDGFTARGVQEPPAVPAATAAPTKRIAPFIQARALRGKVASLEASVAAARAKLDPDVAARGEAARLALNAPDRFRQQAAAVKAVVAGPSPFAATADVTFDGATISVAGALAPGAKAIDALPALKARYELMALSESAGRYQVKLLPRATAR